MLKRLWLCVPPALFEMIDYWITIRGQPAQYWAGDFDAAQEGNPVVRWCMTAHPWMWHGLTFLWLALFSAFIVTTPRGLARFASLAIAFCHAFAICTWFVPDELVLLRELGLCIACAIVMAIALELCPD